MNIKQAKENFDFFYEGDYITREMVESKDVILEHLKQLSKGQHSLMQSRRKWIRRYYNLRQRQKEDMNAIKNVFTKEDIDRIVAETRRMERKAEKYVLLVEKLKEMRKSLNKDGFVGYADEITDILAKVEEEWK